MMQRTVSNLKDLTRCTCCVMPETQESIIFDKDGVCSTCRNIDVKYDIDWDKRKEDFKKLLDNFRGKYDYDCIVPFSGGKDSTYQVYSLVRNYGLKPLVVSYDHHMFRPKTLQNRERTLKRLGVDFLSYRTNWNLVKKLMRIGLERKGNIYWYQETGIFSFPMHMAIKFNVPLVVWGEPSAEYSAYYDYSENEEFDETQFNMFVNMGITAQDMVGFLNDPKITMTDLKYHTFPERKELQTIGCRSIYLGTYESWDVKKNVEIIKKELGWEGDNMEGLTPEYNYEKIEDMLQGVQDYLKFIKRGYGRMSHLVSLDIRHGRMTRDKAMELVEKYEGLRPASLDIFLKWMNMSEEEFYNIAKQHSVKPWFHDSSNIKNDKPLPDMKDWVVE